MAGVVNTTKTFATNEVITSTLMNNIIDETEFTSDAVANGTLAITGGKIKVATGGITANEIAASAVTGTAILDGTITNAKINASAAIDLSKLATGALPTAITIASANIVDGTIATADIADAAITAPKLNGAQTGTAPAYGIRAWANFNSDSATNANATGTYSRTGNTVTVTVTGHGLIVGNLVFIDYTFGSGGAAPFDGLYEVSAVTNANIFTVTSSASTSSTGSVTLLRKTISASGNISCISAAAASPTIPPNSNDSAQDGYYVANFLIAMPSANYSILGTCATTAAFVNTAGNKVLTGSPNNAQSCRILTIDTSNNNPVSNLHNSISIIG
jgi:hypothetical protein